MWRFLAGFSAVGNTEWAEKKIKTVTHVFSKTKLKLLTVQKCVIAHFRITLHCRQTKASKCMNSEHLASIWLSQNLLVLIKKACNSLKSQNVANWKRPLFYNFNYHRVRFKDFVRPTNAHFCFRRKECFHINFCLTFVGRSAIGI